MRKNINAMKYTVLLLMLTASGPLWAQASTAKAKTLWTQMRKADVNSKAFASARANLIDMIDSAKASQKIAIAESLMQRGTEDSINAAALQLFGPQGLPIAGLQNVLENPDRGWPGRVLIRTYYQLLRPEYETRLSEKFRRELLGILAVRMSRLARAGEVGYGEQRLLSQAIQATLSRYAWKQDTVPQFNSLVSAMRSYSGYPRVDDVLGASINGWLKLKPKPAIKTVPAALANLGHWDPLVRMQSATYLANQIRTSPQVGEKVLQMLNDPRDEVKAAAASVFSFALSYNPKRVIPAMVRLLVKGRSVPAQKMAAETLIAHSDEAQMSAEMLIEAIEDSRPKPGPKRTDSILTTLSYLIHDQTAPSLKVRALKVATSKLEFAPNGALKLLEALGPDARSALPAIKAYRDNKADRFLRQYINTHVIESIQPGE